MLFPEIRQLEEYDRMHGVSLVRTLRTYLDCSLNQSRTAATLQVNRSTVILHLETIREVTGIQMEKSSVILLLRLTMAEKYRMDMVKTTQ